MDDFTTLLIIAVISVGIGFAFGNLIANAANARQKTSKSEGGVRDGLMETIRVYRDMNSRAVVLEMRGKKYHKPAELEPRARDFLQQQLSALSAWLKPSELPKSAGVPANDLAAQVHPTAQNSVQVSGSTLSPEPRMSSPAQNDSLKSNYSPVDFFARAIRNDANKSSAPPLSIASQIDEILQEKLAGLPDEKRAIRLMELPGKGMVVMVGLDHYDGVDAVPDPEVKALIRACVREWEQKVDRLD